MPNNNMQLQNLNVNVGNVGNMNMNNMGMNMNGMNNISGLTPIVGNQQPMQLQNLQVNLSGGPNQQQHGRNHHGGHHGNGHYRNPNYGHARGPDTRAINNPNYPQHAQNNRHPANQQHGGDHGGDQGNHGGDHGHAGMKGKGKANGMNRSDTYSGTGGPRINYALNGGAGAHGGARRGGKTPSKSGNGAN